MLESKFQKIVRKDIETRLPGAIILKTDSLQLQGIPDLLILYKTRWAMLEVKRSQNAPRRPNQDFWVNKFNDISFAKFIYPENKLEVLDDLERSLKGYS